jgi:hypothetical protein
MDLLNEAVVAKQAAVAVGGSRAAAGFLDGLGAGGGQQSLEIFIAKPYQTLMNNVLRTFVQARQQRDNPRSK